SPLLHSLVSIETPNSLLDATPPTVWNITLRDPKEAVSLAKVPVVGDHGAHYRHAREVPDAWLVESDSQFEHFIFYRGTGNHYLPVNVVNTRDDIWEMGHTVVDTSHLRAFQVHVKGAQLRWAETPPIPRFGSAVAETSSSSDPAKFDSSQSNLVKSLTTALTEEGLTPAEAAAMVHTWEDAWMKEDGTRLLVLLPQESIDAVLPLSITPQPAETRRVFVARLELLNTTTESHIGRLLDAWPNLSDEDKTFAKSLGRIKSAAFGRAVQIQHNKLLQRSGEVQAALEQ
ncbi:MAG: hypothetical protein KDK97_10085, partial [Verrucomicrobiales bacterium]|nr:hypothetical protein [Verrucomicrobiales bacterium]